MASNEKTPDSVLSAPKVNPVTISAQRGPNRAARRRGETGGIKARVLGKNKPFERAAAAAEDLARNLREISRELEEKGDQS